MKILIVQEKGRHPENESFRECENMRRALAKIGHESIVWGLNQPNYHTSFYSIAPLCDAVLLLEQYETNGWIPDMLGLKKLKLFWSVDSHCALNAHKALCDKHKINIVLTSTNIYTAHYSNTKNYWFPNCYPDDLIHPIPNTIKEWDVGFCGNILNRKPWLDHIQKHFTLRIAVMKIGMEMVKEINSYKIHWNRNLANDVNYRTFETLGCGTLLFTNETDRLRELFDVEKHLVLYENFDDLVDKLNHYILNQDEAKTIAKSGHKHAKTNHTYVTRAHRLVEIIKENI